MFYSLTHEEKCICVQIIYRSIDSDNKNKKKTKKYRKIWKKIKFTGNAMHQSQLAQSEAYILWGLHSRESLNFIGSNFLEAKRGWAPRVVNLSEIVWERGPFSPTDSTSSELDKDKINVESWKRGWTFSTVHECADAGATACVTRSSAKSKRERGLHRAILPPVNHNGHSSRRPHTSRRLTLTIIPWYTPSRWCRLCSLILLQCAPLPFYTYI